MKYDKSHTKMAIYDNSTIKAKLLKKFMTLYYLANKIFEKNIKSGMNLNKFLRVQKNQNCITNQLRKWCLPAHLTEIKTEAKQQS